jgi:hypothetical protein
MKLYQGIGCMRESYHSEVRSVKNALEKKSGRRSGHRLAGESNLASVSQGLT